MENLNLAKDLQMIVNEDHVKHIKQFRWTLKEIENPQWCQVCDKIIKKYVYSYRRGDEVCCSNECLDNFGSIQYMDNDGGRWIYNGEDYEYIPSRSHYEHTNY
jgi:hypothetical protein